MKCIAITAPEKGRVNLEEQEVKEPAEREIQVRVHASIVSPGTERAFILNLDNTNAKYPLRGMGYASAGIVEKAGKKVTKFKVGDRVAVKLSHRSLGNVSEDKAILVPDGVSFKEAAFLTLGVICLQGVRKARIELGEGVLVLGLGLIGQITLQLARISGALPVIGSDIVDEKLKTALKCGANKVMNSKCRDWQEILKAETEGKGPQVVIESTGFPQPISAALESVRQYGRVVLLGSTRGETSVNFYRDVHKKGIGIIGAHTSCVPLKDSYPGFWTYEDNMNCFMKLLENKKLSLKPLITEEVEWDKAMGVYDKLLSWDRDMIATVINWEKG